jgi:hypothetical protein
MRQSSFFKSASDIIIIFFNVDDDHDEIDCDVNEDSETINDEIDCDASEDSETIDDDVSDDDDNVRRKKKSSKIVF